MERFWSKVAITGLYSCWEWRAALNKEGYGSFWLEGKVQGAHCTSYIEARGAIPEGLELDHLCRNKSCVNPLHLEAVTHQVNTKRGHASTHCKNGHERTPENRYGERRCKICTLEWNRDWKRTLRAKKRLNE